MCGRYQGIAESDFQTFGLLPPAEYQQSFNIAPGTFQPTVIYGSWKLQIAKWGLIPFWSKEPRMKFSTINARSETIAVSPAFREAFKKRRCVIPASGFYEWKKIPDGTKIPYYIHVKNSQSFAFAGIWDSWKDAEYKELITYSIVTCPPNDLMQNIHTRMPVILARDAYQEWADPDTSSTALRQLMVPYDSRQMEAFQISTKVNSTAHDSPDIIEKVFILKDPRV